MSIINEDFDNQFYEYQDKIYRYDFQMFQYRHLMTTGSNEQLLNIKK